MGVSVTKAKWSDTWAQRATMVGYRSRSAWKLLDIHKRIGLFKYGLAVLDLGAAPGGWAQVTQKLVVTTSQSTKTKKQGFVLAVDIQKIQPIANVATLQADLYDAAIMSKIKTASSNHSINLVISDVAPALTGIRSRDDNAIIRLNERSLAIAKALPHCHSCLLKSFQSEELRVALSHWRKQCTKIQQLKPLASRSASREVYLFMSGIVSDINADMISADGS